MPCGPPKPRKAVFDTVWVLKPVRDDLGRPAGSRQLSAWNIARSLMASGQVGRVEPQRRGQLQRIALDQPALVVEAHLRSRISKSCRLPVMTKSSSRSRRSLHGRPVDARRRRGGGGQQRRLGLLAAEPAAHAAHLARSPQASGTPSTRATTCCTSRGMLGRGPDMDVAALARDRQRDLAFEIEMLLAADAEPPVAAAAASRAIAASRSRRGRKRSRAERFRRARARPRP